MEIFLLTHSQQGNGGIEEKFRRPFGWPEDGTYRKKPQAVS
jgi:hypothetical protein